MEIHTKLHDNLDLSGDQFESRFKSKKTESDTDLSQVIYFVYAETTNSILMRCSRPLNHIPIYGIR